uniref:Rab-GAP TBC domain-containing protein n=1 Tax=Auxenochlorella protothecoides TaxID=3075 RepID=A0A1D2AGT9_AUXPR
MMMAEPESPGGTTMGLGKRLLAMPRKVHRRMRSVESLTDATLAPSPGEPRVTSSDVYGFAISLTEAHIDALARCTQAAAEVEASWASHPRGGPLPADEALKRLCRRGVPPSLRPWVWGEVSGARARRAARHPSYYAGMAELGRHESPWVHQIELDAPRTFPQNGWVQGQQGQAALTRVLCAFAMHSPEVGYCQGMNYIAALLLLALECDQEAAFWVLASLIDGRQGILYQDMYARDLSGTHVEMRSLHALVATKLPALHDHLAALRCDMSILATDWFLCLFCTALPAEAAARVWDALLCEGPKVLFRVALALMRGAEPALLAAEDAGALLRAMRDAAADAHDRDRLMHDAFESVGGLPMDRIRRYRERNQREVDHEFAARETRRAGRANGDADGRQDAACSPSAGGTTKEELSARGGSFVSRLTALTRGTLESGRTMLQRRASSPTTE